MPMVCDLGLLRVDGVSYLSWPTLGWCAERTSTNAGRTSVRPQSEGSDAIWLHDRG